MISEQTGAKASKATRTVMERPSVRLINPRYTRLKRMIDLVLCFSLMPVAALLSIFIAIAIRLNSPGTILFVQERIGKGGKPFTMIKFRTMYQNIDKTEHQAYMQAYVRGQITTAQNNEAVFKPTTQDQITPVGHFLRKTSLDEIPQLINVFLGEMSFVGPRPNVPWEVEAYQAWHQERLEVLPGITGLAQVRGRSGIAFDEIVAHDITYINNQGLWLDLKIMWWTVKSVSARKGAY